MRNEADVIAAAQHLTAAACRLGMTATAVFESPRAFVFPRPTTLTDSVGHVFTGGWGRRGCSFQQPHAFSIR